MASNKEGFSRKLSLVEQNGAASMLAGGLALIYITRLRYGLEENFFLRGSRPVSKGSR